MIINEPLKLVLIFIILYKDLYFLLLGLVSNNTIYYSKLIGIMFIDLRKIKL